MEQFEYPESIREREVGADPFGDSCRRHFFVLGGQGLGLGSRFWGSGCGV